MRSHLGNKQRDLFDIKTDEGGITDIEFIAQYLVLRYAPGEPRLTRWSDNVRIFELMANYDIMPEEEARADPGLCHHARRDPPSGAAGAFRQGRQRAVHRRARAGARQLGQMAGLIPFCGYSGGLW
ncbi:hypothetical protein M5585_06620 [Serratia ureilytica]